MITRILATVITETNIARRNQWVLIAVLLMVLFSLVLSAAGSAPTGALGADRLSVIVASLTSLSVYLVPLVALLMSFDAVCGEVERGTLPLLLTYPAARWEVLAGKLLAHTAILVIAIVAGYGAAAVIAIAADPASVSGLGALWRLTWSSVLLGATFLGIGYALSSLARRSSGAAGLAIGLWLGLVVLYDLGLLAAVVADDGGFAVPLHNTRIAAQRRIAARHAVDALDTGRVATRGIGTFDTHSVPSMTFLAAPVGAWIVGVFLVRCGIKLMGFCRDIRFNHFIPLIIKPSAACDGVLILCHHRRCHEKCEEKSGGRGLQYGFHEIISNLLARGNEFPRSFIHQSSLNPRTLIGIIAGSCAYKQG